MPAKKTKNVKGPKPGDEIVLEFLDHVQCDGCTSEPLPIVLYGFVIENAENHIKIDAWRIPRDEKLNKGNRVSYTVVKHAGAVYTLLKRTNKKWKF